MTFLAQAAAAVQQMTPSSSSPIETLGLVGIAYALVRVLDGLIAKVIPGKLGKRACAFSEPAAESVARMAAAVDDEGRPRWAFPSRRMDEHHDQELEILRGIAETQRKAVDILGELKSRPCPAAKDART